MINFIKLIKGNSSHYTNNDTGHLNNEELQQSSINQIHILTSQKSLESDDISRHLAIVMSHNGHS